ncbi:MAG: PEP-CTERM sorting domain-containing protein [bacterium]
MTQPHARDRSFRRSSIRAGSRAYLETRSGAGRLRSGSAIPKAILAIGLLFAWAPAAQAVTVGFGCITSNDATDCAIGEAQLTVEVSDAGGGEVLFLFENAGPASSSITGVFFDDGTLLGISGLIDADDDALGSFGDPGVDFSAGSGSPPELPGGNAVGFQTTVGFLADSDPPTAPNGVQPLESLGVVFALQSGGVLADVIDELTDGTLRIGIHVQDFAGGGSESFVNLPVPEPGASLLLGLGLMALARRGAPHPQPHHPHPHHPRRPRT